MFLIFIICSALISVLVSLPLPVHNTDSVQSSISVEKAPLTTMKLARPVNNKSQSPDTVFLGELGTESLAFKIHCLEQCRKKSGKPCKWHEGGKKNRFGGCKSESHGFMSAPTCCFWKKCYSKVIVVTKEAFHHIMWFQSVKKQLTKEGCEYRP